LQGVRHDLGDGPRVRPGLEQQHLAMRVLGEPRGRGAPRRPAADDDHVIVVMHHIIPFAPSSCWRSRLVNSPTISAVVARRTISPRMASRPFTSTSARYDSSVARSPTGSRVMAISVRTVLLVTE